MFGPELDNIIIITHPLTGGIAPVVASVLLGQVHNGDAVRGHSSPGVEGSLLNGLTIMDPLDLRGWVAFSLALKRHCLSL